MTLSASPLVWSGGKNHGYAHEMTHDEHDELVVRAAALESSVLISGYPHPDYDVPLELAGFERITIATHATASRATSGRGDRTEVLWRRCAHGTRATLFDP